MSKNTLIALWSMVGVVGLAAVLIVGAYSASSRRAKTAAANEQVSHAVTTAEQWINGELSLDGETVEQQLLDALADERATDRRSGQSALAQVRQRRQELAERARVERAQQQAAAILDNAMAEMEAQNIHAALALLNDYIDHAHATEAARAQQLLEEAEAAISDEMTRAALIALSDEQLDLVKRTGVIDDGKVSRPALVSIRKQTIERNLPLEVHKREQIRLAEQRREATQQSKERREEQANKRAKQAATAAIAAHGSPSEITDRVLLLIKDSSRKLPDDANQMIALLANELVAGTTFNPRDFELGLQGVFKFDGFCAPGWRQRRVVLADRLLTFLKNDELVMAGKALVFAATLESLLAREHEGSDVDFHIDAGLHRDYVSRDEFEIWQGTCRLVITELEVFADTLGDDLIIFRGLPYEDTVGRARRRLEQKIADRLRDLRTKVQ
ncbi:MAG: hypothetical protein RBS80_28000 [Thermoguttaceae bacterium]|jgi:hypothetical protein|nr:hypothetical protein [Thermoguttaceae bacterium]